MEQVDLPGKGQLGQGILLQQERHIIFDQVRQCHIGFLSFSVFPVCGKSN
jgi:hypothetical protein